MKLRVTRRLGREIRRAEDWWDANRPAGTFRREVERAEQRLLAAPRSGDYSSLKLDITSTTRSAARW